MYVAAAEARRVLLSLASERLKVPVQDLTVARGVVSVRRDPQRSVTYGELLGNKPFDRKFEAVAYSAGAELPRKSADVAPFKSRAATNLRTRPGRTDMPDKVSGKYDICSTSSPRDAPRPRRGRKARWPAASPPRKS
jgi:hypothetical protein